ncbi:MAG: methyltransferase domain-containing protein [Lentisphaeria bacterium]|nr:methyltransferase domain-containing protein [Lentisphaeria bacterium]
MIDLINTWQTLQFPEGSQERRVEFDMGCGKGRFTVELARRYPESVVFCNDIISERLRIVERRALRAGATNLHAMRATSLALVSYQLPPNSLDRLHLLCPDPWPKKGHTARRLVCTDFLCRVPRVLKKGGIFHLSTDHTPYYEDWLRMFAQLDSIYEPVSDGIADMADVKTDFELKWNALGQEVHHICYRVK